MSQTESESDESVVNLESDNIQDNSTTSSKLLVENLDSINDRLMAKQFRKSAIDYIDEKRELFTEYKKDQKGRMISFLTCILVDPLTPIFNQILNQYLNPLSFSIFEGMQADQVKKLIVSQEQIEMLQHKFQKGDEEKNIFKLEQNLIQSD